MVDDYRVAPARNYTGEFVGCSSINAIGETVHRAREALVFSTPGRSRERLGRSRWNRQAPSTRHRGSVRKSTAALVADRNAKVDAGIHY
jgi:hypothetical protein